MREIKFRAWDKEKKITVYDYDQSISEHYNMEIGQSIHELVWKIGKHYNTLMQFTGLKDKNGKEIYEGDFLSIYPEEPEINKVIQVEWCSDYCKFGWNISGAVFCKSNENLFLIIGNIYENPELIGDIK